jgi:hypothetical protein
MGGKNPYKSTAIFEDDLQKAGRICLKNVGLKPVFCRRHSACPPAFCHEQSILSLLGQGIAR